MAKKMVEALDLLLKDLMETNMLFGGKMVVFNGDFRQILPLSPVVEKEKILSVKAYCALKFGINLKDCDYQRICERKLTRSFDSLNILFRVTYPDLFTSNSNVSFIISRAILTPKNDFVDEINDMLITQFPTDAKVYVATD
ncbi:uncharacterized protein LOC132053782 [Lycium ferocissimum]|uniref:uncharacterized protein LOC132053782 n=1 Tax=Lycium ferocissimum TaxID=112874 RepID=UPI002815CD47|nr:uncharacterized protein LOC132053782 [Lycium ferocissimum]